MRKTSDFAPLLLVASGALAAPNAALADSAQLLRAARLGHREVALELLRADGDAAAVEADGTSVLHWAVQDDNALLASALLAAGADPRATNRYGITPLFLAAENGSATLLEVLLNAGADANATVNYGESALMTVARNGSLDAARVLLDHGADVDAREKWHGQTALMWAAGAGHPAMIALLIGEGADVNARSAVEIWERQTTAEPRAKWLPPGGMTPLLFAAREGCLACVAELVRAGADLNATTPDGISAVLSALINGHYDVAAELVAAGVDPNLVDESGRGALYAAVDFSTMPSSNRPAPDISDNAHSALDIAVMLIERGADVNARLTSQSPYRAKLDRGNDTVLSAGTTPLMRAAKAADIAAMTILLDAGADPGLSNERRGVTAALLAAGVGTAEQDTTGRYKTEAQAIAALELLSARGADLFATDSRGRTAAHGAALQGYNEVLKYLAVRGLDLNQPDDEGYTPLDTALGLAGGFGFAGAEGIAREETAAVIRDLLGTTGP